MSIIQCPSCRQENHSDAEFCSNCGVDFTPSATPGKMKNKGLLYLVGGILALLAVVCSICGVVGWLEDKKKQANVAMADNTNPANTNSAPTAAPSVQAPAKIYANLPELANKTVAEVESKLGASGRVTKVENKLKQADFVEGENREYKVQGTQTITLQIFFYKGKAIEFKIEHVEYDDRTNTADEFAERFGFLNTKMTPSDNSENYKSIWRGVKFGEIEFKELEIIKLRGYFSRLNASVRNDEIEKIITKQIDNSTIKTLKSSETTQPKSSGKYIRGPRGGCYYITSGGSKEYVDRSLCN
jgi:hypothetical protein